MTAANGFTLDRNVDTSFEPRLSRGRLMRIEASDESRATTHEQRATSDEPR